MRRILLSISTLILLTGCAETVAFLGPVSSMAGGGNLARSTFTSTVDYGIKKSTGKSSIEHAMSFADKADKNNSDRKKEKCVNFLEMTETEVCSALKKRVSDLRSKIDKHSKVKILD